MFAASCLASCCAACACDACRTVVSGISRRSARIAYCGLFALSLIVSWILREVAAPLMEKIPWINHFSQTPDREWFETDAVLRVSLGNFLFFTILALLMVGVKSQKDPRDVVDPRQQILFLGGWSFEFEETLLSVDGRCNLSIARADLSQLGHEVPGIWGREEYLNRFVLERGHSNLVGHGVGQPRKPQRGQLGLVQAQVAVHTTVGRKTWVVAKNNGVQGWACETNGASSSIRHLCPKVVTRNGCVDMAAANPGEPNWVEMIIVDTQRRSSDTQLGKVLVAHCESVGDDLGSRRLAEEGGLSSQAASSKAEDGEVDPAIAALEGVS
ncbi:hypothetical protein TEA_008586 [Camellia sinensis var. sinensis]|uniref:Uncharacterized protein n=1 Tax=Camellia sinensis var. sinensis TaxID=542762 RepID=A0A4S4EM08_CAMSN|nr:hypothetical protein TEA_008586 [Camellia sinensis var. sinensis]